MPAGLTVSISLIVPALPDNDVCFANNAAWQNYWRDITVGATFNPVSNMQYVESNFDSGLQYVTIYAEGLGMVNVPTMDQFNSLLAAYEALNLSYKDMREKLKEAGLLEEAQ